MEVLSAVIIGESDDRAAVLEQGWRLAAATVRHYRLSLGEALPARVDALAPDVVLIDLPDPVGNSFDRVLELCRSVQRPVVLFVEQASPSVVSAAIEAGVSAFVVNALEKHRIKSIANVARTRFEELKKLRAELQRSRNALDERKLIQRAKAILMEARNLTESQAYAFLRKSAMNQNRKIAEVASAVLAASEFLSS
jgi:response regulator NasT